MYLHDPSGVGAGGACGAPAVREPSLPTQACGPDDVSLKQSKASMSISHFTDDEIAELEKATAQFQASKLPLHELCRENFPLPTLAAKAAAASRAVHDPLRGFARFRGLDPKKYTPIQNVILHAGLASHVGNRRAMSGIEDGSREVLHHITNLDTDDAVGSVGLANQTVAIPFHSDPGHVLSFFTLSSGASGGSLYLANNALVHKRLKSLRPDLVEVLESDWPMESYDPLKTIEPRPVWYSRGPHVMASIYLTRILGGPHRPRPASLPRITSEQRQALEELDGAAGAVAERIDQEPGDVLFFNNLGMLHSRDAFCDDVAAGSKRHILHLVIRDDELAWEVPEQLAAQHHMVYEHDTSKEIFSVEEVPFTDASIP